MFFLLFKEFRIVQSFEKVYHTNAHSRLITLKKCICVEIILLSTVFYNSEKKTFVWENTFKNKVGFTDYPAHSYNFVYVTYILLTVAVNGLSC